MDNNNKNIRIVYLLSVIFSYANIKRKKYNTIEFI